ncbi:IQ motif EF-hand binding site [Arabidopsis thaliana x Arabidopsis arenosa]|uniref:IQ motif EF-hand binding site n=1 Tax=Arabidopsis thaliana x Arabidopsis arenosa TaxID=1240361 RepID=A0A8T2GYY6_9BRAS|nr:IQ motif EF-hand binding site [Arabidopsis thaliana x Arabidopsis arenosa]
MGLSGVWGRVYWRRRAGFKAIKIQSAFKAYLARKALWAVKALVSNHSLCNSKGKCNGWDSSALTKEDIKAIWLRKQEGVIKRDRMLKYSRSHQERRSPHMLEDSLSTPRQRVGLMDSLFVNYKKDGDKVSLWTSFVCENSKINNAKKSSLTTYQHNC